MFKYRYPRLFAYNQPTKLAVPIGQVKTKFSREITTLYTNGLTVNDVYYDTDESEVYNTIKKTLNSAYPRENLIYYAYLYANGKTIYDIYYDEFDE